MMKEVVVQDLTEPIRMFKKRGIWRIQIDIEVSTNLIMRKY